MDAQRQQAFEKLRTPCVELYSVSLRFKGQQASSKDVLRALNAQYDVLQEIGSQGVLDLKLAEYAFQPLTHVLNASKTLSPRCLEVTIQSITILVSQGWQQQLSPEMGKQLLLLMSLTAGGGPRQQTDAPGAELRSVAFCCMAAIIQALGKGPAGHHIFNDQVTKNITDQLVFQLAEAISDDGSSEVQLAAANVLSGLVNQIGNRIFLASLLPRVVSALVKALRPSTQVRRTYRVFRADLDLLTLCLQKVLSDAHIGDGAEGRSTASQTLDAAWLKATSAQIKIALDQVVKLRNHERQEVHDGLVHLCTTIIENCGQSLSQCVPTALETLVILRGRNTNSLASQSLKRLMLLQPQLSDMLQSAFFDWTQALPRVMHGSDDRPKQLMLARIRSSLDLLGDALAISDSILERLGSTLLNTISTALDQGGKLRIQEQGFSNDNVLAVANNVVKGEAIFKNAVLSHESQHGLMEQMQALMGDIRSHPSMSGIARTAIDAVSSSQGNTKLAAIWLAINLLHHDSNSPYDIDDLMHIDTTSGRDNTRPYLIQDLYAFTKDLVLDSSPHQEQPPDWRLTALSLEVLVLQTQQLGFDYRIELFETLYPILALLGSTNAALQDHAATTLNALASACHYRSARDLLVENVDYLVNSIAWKLNTFNLSPEAPRVLDLLIKLVGAKLLPYLDDLITSIFAALDNYHGYAEWVETLFEVFSTMVEESTKQPQLAIKDIEKGYQPQIRSHLMISATADIIADLRARKRQKSYSSPSQKQSVDSAPHRPWTKPLDDPTYDPKAHSEPDTSRSLEDLLNTEDEAPLEASDNKPQEEQEQDDTAPTSKSHSLLLQIAQSTVPHLSSPSPRVRRLLLDLLKKIVPLLAAHENTFLPLVNNVWDGVIARLFSFPGDHNLAFQETEMNAQTDASYNIVAAAEVVNVLCECAGDFMGSRVERIFPQLCKLFKGVHTNVQANRIRNSNSSMLRDAATRATKLDQVTERKAIRGTVDLQVVRTAQENLAPGPLTTAIPRTSSTGTVTSARTHTNFMPSATRTSSSQILSALVEALITILDYVHVSADTGDAILELLSPFILRDYGILSQKVQEVCQRYNDDAVWLIMAREQAREVRQTGTGIMRNVDESLRWSCSTPPTVRSGSLVAVAF